MRITFVAMVTTILSTLMHVPLCFLFVKVFEMELGATDSVRKLMHLVFLIVTGTCSKHIRSVFTIPDRDTFCGLYEYAHVVMYLTLMYCSEV